MSSTNIFHIIVDTEAKGKFRMEVEHYYSSKEVERFKIKGKNDRHIPMEKRLRLKRQPWKLTKIDINNINYPEAAMAIRDMQDAIDRYLEARE